MKNKNKTKKTIAKTTIIYSTINNSYNMIEHNRVTVDGYLYSTRLALKRIRKSYDDDAVDVVSLDRFSLDNR